jgi:hypothetical protein
VIWWVEVLGVCVRMSLGKFEWRSAKLCMLGVVSFWVPCIWGHVLSPLMGGSASVNVVSGVLSLNNAACGCIRFVVVCDSRV